MSIRNRLLKLAFIGVLALAVFAAGLLGNRGNRAFAQDMEPQNFVVQAGAQGPANVELLAFAPSNIQVHRGDTITWSINSFHNVHIGEAPNELMMAPEVDGQPLLQINPAAGFPSIESGDAYAGGDANSGLPAGESFFSLFSLVVDVEPGIYTYFCDVHPGMTGTIEVVADDQPIPSPSDVAAQASTEIAEQTGAAVGDYFAENAAASPFAVDGVATIVTGTSGTGRALSLSFISPLAVIKAGESVTWVNPADSIDPHFVNSADYNPETLPDVVPMEQAGGPPILAAGPGFLGTTQSGATIQAGDSFHSGFILPGQSFTLTFADPGIYPFICHIHPGMGGGIVVQPA
jgi:plastocyanin